MNGCFYLRGNRWWWKVRLPGDKKITKIPLKPTGAKFATKDRKTAEIVAAEIWQKHIKHGPAAKWDGKIETLVKKYDHHNINFFLPPSTQAVNIGYAIRPFAAYFPTMMAEDFNPLQLKAYQAHLTAVNKLCRKGVNRHTQMIKSMFKWAVSEMLIPACVYQAIACVENLKQGRTVARESREVHPANLPMVDATIARLTPILADMVRLQLLTGMRSGELCRIRPADIDRTKEIWFYRPAATQTQYAHKTGYLGHKKIVPIGPKGQKILTKYLFRDAQDFCFKPIESEKYRRDKLSENRKTPLSCGNRPGLKTKGTQKFNDYFESGSYRNAIARVCRVLYPAPKESTPEQRKQWEKQHSWHPHQIRHTVAGNVWNEIGPEYARALLGHQKLNMTDWYAKMDLTKAEEVAKLMG